MVQVMSFFYYFATIKYFIPSVEGMLLHGATAMNEHDKNDIVKIKLIDDRYKRHILVKDWDQMALNDGRLCVVGVGGLGCEVVKNMALMGVKTFTLIDPDTVDASNLSRQMFFAMEDINKPKCTAVAKKAEIMHLNDGLHFDCYKEYFQDVHESVFVSADVLVSCVDSIEARKDLNKIAVILNKPMVDGGFNGFRGYVRTIIPGTTACFDCNDPQPSLNPFDIDAACTLVGAPRRRGHCLAKAQVEFQGNHGHEPDFNSASDFAEILESANRLARIHGFQEFEGHEVLGALQNKVPSLLTTCAIIAGFQSQEVVKVLHAIKGRNIGKITEDRVEFDTRINQRVIEHINKWKNCKCCGNANLQNHVLHGEASIDQGKSFKDLFLLLQKENIIEADVAIERFVVWNYWWQNRRLFSGSDDADWNTMLSDRTNGRYFRIKIDIKSKDMKGIDLTKNVLLRFE